MTVRELTLTYGRGEPLDVPDEPISTSDAAARVLAPLLADRATEATIALYLTQRHYPIGYQIIGVGTLTECPLDPAVITRGALLANAAAVVLAHNHPSGVVRPSPDDCTATEAIGLALALFKIRLLDHLVLAGDDCYSIASSTTGRCR